MSAYAHCTRAEHLERTAARARRRRQLDELAAHVNARLGFRTRDSGPRLRRASDLLESDHPAHQALGRALYARARREERLRDRDERLLAGEHPGSADGRYLAACAYAEAWGLPVPPGTSRGAVG